MERERERNQCAEVGKQMKVVEIKDKIKAK